jgi:hypothetical protein
MLSSSQLSDCHVTFLGSGRTAEQGTVRTLDNCRPIFGAL